MQQAEAAEAEDSSEDEEVQAPRSKPKMQVPGTQQSVVEDLGEPSEEEEGESTPQPPQGSMVEDLGDASESE
jgi:hypothetical protein